MERIAVISDIHGNIPALEAVLKDIKIRNINRIFCLGDLVGKGPHSHISVDIIQQVCEVSLLGNWDDGITKPSEYQDIVWHQKKLGESRLKYLSSLSFSFEFYMSGRRIRLFHASPQSVHKRIQPHSSVEDRLSMFDNTDLTGKFENDEQPNVVGYGDIHNAYVQNFRGKTLFNVGSVGNPLEITQSSYAILEGVYDSKELSSFSIQLVRVPYDVELAIKQAEDENMPDIEPYILELKTAIYRGKMNKE